jgi:hypothetical protein
VTAAFALALVLFQFRQSQIAGTWGFTSFPLDDSWIHFHFARNLAEGHGFAYNPGVPVAGSTAPLWTLVLAGGFALLGPQLYWAKVAGIAAGLATALVTARLAARWTSDRWLALLAGVAMAISGPLVWGALSGMEVDLAALLVTAALLSHTNVRDWTPALLLGLAALTRPEALLLVPLVWMARPITARRTGIFVGVTALCLAPWVTFNLVTAGTPLPATASAKVEGGLIGFLSGTSKSETLWERPGQFELEWVQWLWSVNVLLPFLILGGLSVIWRVANAGPRCPRPCSCSIRLAWHCSPLIAVRLPGGSLLHPPVAAGDRRGGDSIGCARTLAEISSGRGCPIPHGLDRRGGRSPLTATHGRCRTSTRCRCTLAVGWRCTRHRTRGWR